MKIKLINFTNNVGKKPDIKMYILYNANFYIFQKYTKLIYAIRKHDTG